MPYISIIQPGQTFLQRWQAIDSKFETSIETIDIDIATSKLKIYKFDGSSVLSTNVIPYPVTGGTNGVNKVGTNILLGGDLTTGTTIDTKTYNFLMQSGTGAQRLRLSNTFAELAGDLQLRIQPPSIQAASAIDGQFLKLIDENTGECDYDYIVDSDFTSLSIVSDKVRLTFKDTSYIETAGLPARSYAENHIAATAATVISVAGTYVKAAGTTTLDDASADFTQPLNNKLLYGGAATKKFLLNLSLSFQTTAANQTLAARIYKNGVAETSSTMTTRAQTSGQPTTLSINRFIELSTNDYVEIWVTNQSGTNNVTVINSSLSLLQL